MFGEVELKKELYEVLEQNSSLLIVSARERGRLVGYAIYFISESIFNKKIQAESHSFYMIEECRKGYNAINMFLFAEEHLKKRKVEILLQKVSLYKDISKIFQKMQYRHIEEVYAKEL